MGKTLEAQTNMSVRVTDYSGTINKVINRPATTFPNRICHTMTLTADVTYMIFYEDSCVAASGTTYNFDTSKKVMAIFFSDLTQSTITIS